MFFLSLFFSQSRASFVVPADISRSEAIKSELTNHLFTNKLLLPSTSQAISFRYENYKGHNFSYASLQYILNEDNTLHVRQSKSKGSFS